MDNDDERQLDRYDTRLMRAAYAVAGLIALVFLLGVAPLVCG